MKIARALVSGLLEPPTRIFAAVMVAFVAVAPALSLGQTQRGIRLLTEQTLSEATARGASEQPRIDELTLLDTVSSRVYPLDRMLNDPAVPRLSHILNPPFTIAVISPFAAAVIEVAEAKRKYQPIPMLDSKELNAGQVLVRVSAGKDFTRAGVVESVVVKRGTVVAHPLKATVTPTSIQNRLGATRESADGYFTFDVAVFEPSSAITIVVVGKGENFEWPLSIEELEHLR